MSRLISSSRTLLRMSKLGFDTTTAAKNNIFSLSFHQQRDHNRIINFRLIIEQQHQQQYITTISEAKQILGLLSVDNNHHIDHQKQRHEHHHHHQQHHLSHEHYHHQTQQHHLSNSEIRKAYFRAAKLCHPDTRIIAEDDQQQRHLDRNDVRKSKKNPPSTKGDDNDDAAFAMVERFHRITQAYELLISINKKSRNHDDYDDDDIDSLSMDDEMDYRMACQNILGLSAEIVEESKRSSTFRQWLLGKTDSAYLWRTFLSQYGGLVPKLRKIQTPLLISSSSNDDEKTTTTKVNESEEEPKIRRRRPRF